MSGAATIGEALATVNACLNATCAVLLVLGRRAIKANRVARHRRIMIAAFATASVFLASYVTRFSLTGVHRFQGTGALRAAYFAILGSHTILAIATVPLAVTALVLGLRGRYQAHRRVVRWAWPIWMYVSVTGVVVYVLLYRLAG